LRIQPEILQKHNAFRTLCLKNAEDAIRAAETLQDKGLNHICYHLATLGLEEIGKVFIGWYNLNTNPDWDREKNKIPLDDHIKKLFWSIWGPSIGQETIDKKQIEEYRGMASKIHSNRLATLYTEIHDEKPARDKLSSDETNDLVRFARARLTLATHEWEFPEKIEEGETSEDLAWFLKASDEPLKRNFIFSKESQEKMVEFDDVKDWIQWLRNYLESEDAKMQDLLNSEVKRDLSKAKFKPKWRISIKLTSPSHSIRAKHLKVFNEKSELIKLKKGEGTHTLLVDLFLTEHTPATELWHQGWLMARIFVASINVGSNGVFYWNMVIDTDRFYSKMWDIENKQQLEARLATDLRIDWKEKGMYLSEDQLILSLMTFRYFSSLLSSQDFEYVNHYMIGLGMLAKTDIHLRLETQCFRHFYLSYKISIHKKNLISDSENFRDVGYNHIDGLLPQREEYDRVLAFGEELDSNPAIFDKPISLTEVIAMKQYCSMYFMTLASRYQLKDETIKLTPSEH